MCFRRNLLVTLKNFTTIFPNSNGVGGILKMNAGKKALHVLYLLKVYLSYFLQNIQTGNQKVYKCVA